MIVPRPVSRSEFRLLHPGRAASYENINRARIDAANIVVIRRPRRDGVARQAERKPQSTAGPRIIREQLRLLHPRSLPSREDIDRAGVWTALVVANGANRNQLAIDGDG